MKLSELKQGQWFKEKNGNIAILVNTRYNEYVYDLFNVTENVWCSYLIDEKDIDVELLPTPNYEKLFAPKEYRINLDVYSKARLESVLNSDIAYYVKNGCYKKTKFLNTVKEMIFEKKAYTTNNIQEFDAMLYKLDDYFSDYEGRRYSWNCNWNNDRTCVDITFD